MATPGTCEGPNLAVTSGREEVNEVSEGYRSIQRYTQVDLTKIFI